MHAEPRPLGSQRSGKKGSPCRRSREPDAYRGGWDISYYKFMDGHPNSHTQSLDLKEIACDAFANVLKQHGMTAYGIGRAD